MADQWDSPLAAATSEEEATLEEVVEPHLIQLGFIERTHEDVWRRIKLIYTLRDREIKWDQHTKN